ncbi:MAG: hypothetical protein OEW42_11675 [Acidimicrobiia bacterium]|nr:hypothetical protein [Acidimicrobiia bacterium]MDH5238496.1 hypothetical protein [Acidimicrobiia bacterium]
MRKSLLVLLSLFLPFTLVAAACGSDEESDGGTDTEVTDDGADVTTTAVADEEMTDEETTTTVAADEEMTDEETTTTVAAE